VPWDVDTFDIPYRQGSRADETHITLKDVEELRQLVNAETPEEFAEAGYAWVVFDFEDRAICFIQVFEHLLLFLCPLNHRPEFKKSKTPFVKADALLPKEDRAW
jgi:hypothetical protein